MLDGIKIPTSRHPFPFSQTRCGLIGVQVSSRSSAKANFDHPDGVSAEDVRKLHDFHGIKTVIDLRTKSVCSKPMSSAGSVWFEFS